MTIFNLLSILISVSGSTYTAVLAVRSIFAEAVREEISNADSNCEALMEVESFHHIKLLKAFKWVVWVGRYSWLVSLALPAGTFLIFAAILALNVIGTPWNPATIDEIKGYSPDSRYIWWLSVIVLINLFSVLLTLLGRLATCAGSSMLNNLREGQDKLKAEDLKKPSASPIITST
ncbi:hypothetical protein [Rhodopirellula sp. SWK7]|uniref:hypothetical protein n=1 Tax=Rhodopirellula sp. SWK7 TaxID=595460 RepID=UPI0002BEF230|nr:hypothetical protein [Rhodopirellula sp. SWK7]EMI40551.1 membrane protein [Rhodopirellula sp. SWK7]